MSVLRIIEVFVAVLAVLAVAGTIWHGLVSAREKRAYSPPGRLVDVGGYRLHLVSTGAGPGPTVVILTGRGHPALFWLPVIQELGATCRVCAYDRPGYGWSDPPLMPRTPEMVTCELHELLERAGLPGPYLLVGHSLGGMYARLYAARYPNEVAGVVLVDARHEAVSGLQPRAFSDVDRRFYRFVRLPNRIGLTRLLDLFRPGLFLGDTGALKQYPPELRSQVDAISIWPPLLPATAGETACLPAIEQALKLAPKLGEKPLVVLSAGKQPTSGWGIDADEWERLSQIWQETQARLVGLSTRGRQVVVEDSGHNIFLERPDVVVAAVLEARAATRTSATT